MDTNNSNVYNNSSDSNDSIISLTTREENYKVCFQRNLIFSIILVILIILLYNFIESKYKNKTDNKEDNKEDNKKQKYVENNKKQKDV